MLNLFQYQLSSSLKMKSPSMWSFDLFCSCDPTYAIAALEKMVLKSPTIWSLEEKIVLMFAPTYAALGKMALKSPTI